MGWLQNLLSQFTELFKWFYILQPWEQALRVRAGKYIKLHKGGIHFKIPYIDFVFKQNTRLRISEISAQTVTTKDDKTITLSGSLSYRVNDITPLYKKLHSAEVTLARHTQGIISNYIAWHDFNECSPKILVEYTNSKLNLTQYGLADAAFLLKDFAVVKTYRFITGDMHTWTEHPLETNND